MNEHMITVLSTTTVTVFPTAFPRAYMHIEEGKAYKFSFGKTKDGTVTLEDVHV